MNKTIESNWVCTYISCSRDASYAYAMVYRCILQLVCFYIHIWILSISYTNEPQYIWILSIITCTCWILSTFYAYTFYGYSPYNNFLDTLQLIILYVSPILLWHFNLSASCVSTFDTYTKAFCHIMFLFKSTHRIWGGVLQRRYRTWLYRTISSLFLVYWD